MMRHPSRVLNPGTILPSVFLIMVMSGTASNFADESATTGTLSGQVVDSDGKPVGGASIKLGTLDIKTRSPQTLAEGRTDLEGRFRLGPMASFASNRFNVSLDVERQARYSFLPGAITIYEGRDNDLGKVQLDRGRVFTGQVVDVDGKPRPNTPVGYVLYRSVSGHTVGDIGSKESLITDEQGRFRTPPLPICDLSVTVRVPERKNAFVRKTVQPGGEEDLGVIQLENDVPFLGLIQDEEGHGIAGVKLGGTVGHEAVTDADGRFTFRGFAANPSFQLNVNKDGYAPLLGRVVVKDDSVTYAMREGDNGKSIAKNGVLIVTMKRAGWIEGEVIDDATEKPIRVTRVVVCNFERKPSGEVVLRGCRSDFEQQQPGRFRASYPAPDEYHLTFSAEGYHDAEAYTPKVSELKTIDGIVVRMKPKTEGSRPDVAKQTISGIVKRNGQTVTSGWASLCLMRGPTNPVNAPVEHGRMVEDLANAGTSVPIRDGTFSFNAPYQGDQWFITIREPGKAVTQVGPISIALNENKRLDIACTEGGQIRGHVKAVPAEWVNHAWVVAFSKTGVHGDARVDRDGGFILPLLPPGEYGLKVGHDAFDDPEVYPGKLAMEHPESFKQKADPWKQAKVVTVVPGVVLDGVELEWPEPVR